MVPSDITEFSSLIEVGIDPESQLHEVLTETEPPEMVVLPHPVLLVRADDQDARDSYCMTDISTLLDKTRHHEPRELRYIYRQKAGFRST